MPATAHRGTPASSLNVSSSQVTAPVLEFRCMFTHDIFKKQKKWHDGSLRFHTFNRRVMVYDDSKNLVGDLHYRSAEDFAEGLELRLDKPVLVQVEEQLGETNTDLTVLLGRQKQDAGQQSMNPIQATRATLTRINAANSKVRPKSIKELLGASQGRLGRARLPVSPNEERHVFSESQSTELSSKTRKKGSRKENEIVATCTIPTSTTSRAPSPVPIRPTDRQAPRDIVQLSSDDEPFEFLSVQRTNTMQKDKSNQLCESPRDSSSTETRRHSPRPAKAKTNAPEKDSRVVQKNIRRAVTNITEAEDEDLGFSDAAHSKGTEESTADKRTKELTKRVRKKQKVVQLPLTIVDEEENIELPLTKSGKFKKRKRQSTNDEFHRSEEEARKKQKNGELQVVATNDGDVALPMSIAPHAASSVSRKPFNASMHSQDHLSTGPRSSLKFPTQKTRPKLMYRALLKDPQPAHASSLPNTGHLRKESEKLTSSLAAARPRRNHVLDTDKFFSLTQITAEDATTAPPSTGLSQQEPNWRSKAHIPTDECTNSPAEKSSNRGPDSPFQDVPDSPLFVPQATSQRSMDSTQSRVADDFAIPGLSQESQEQQRSNDVTAENLTTSVYDEDPTSHTDQKKRNTMATSPSKCPDSVASSPLFPAPEPTPPPQHLPKAVSKTTSKVPALSPIHAVDSSPASITRKPEPTKLNNQTLHNLFRTDSPRIRPFRRVVSENLSTDRTAPEDSTDNDDESDSAFEALTKNSPARARQTVINALESPAPAIRHPPLRTSTSNPLTLDHLVTEPIATEEELPSPTFQAEDQFSESTAAAAIAQPVPAAQQEIGPWTSMEAFLLFDRWPSGKTKPDYGQSGNAGAGAGAGSTSAAMVEDASLSRMAASAMSKKKYGTFGSARFVSQR